MECPFCIETIKDESLVCRHCTRDLALVRPIILEIHKITDELDELQRQLDHARTRLAMVETPGRFLLLHGASFIVLPAVMLLAAHFLITVAFDISSIYLRLASVLIPLPFGFALAVLRNIGFRGAIAFGIATAALAIPGMLAVTAYVDGGSVAPSNWREWREVLEYGTSIALAFCAGNFLPTVLFRILPPTLSSPGKPGAAAYWLTRMWGPHVGKEALRRRARLIQDVLRTAGPVIGFGGTAAGEIYTGLKSILAH
jgi:hypothetical protein